MNDKAGRSQSMQVNNQIEDVLTKALIKSIYDLGECMKMDEAIYKCKYKDIKQSIIRIIILGQMQSLPNQNKCDIMYE